MDDSTKINNLDNSEELDNIQERDINYDDNIELSVGKNGEDIAVKENYDEYVPYGKDEDSSVNPYLEADPTIPNVVYSESPFLPRGCSRCPESYEPVSETELSSCCKLDAKDWMKNIMMA